jgi:hypothetical protein
MPSVESQRLRHICACEHSMRHATYELTKKKILLYAIESKQEIEMAASSCRVAVLVLLFFPPAVMLLASAPCAAAAASRVLHVADDLPRAGVEAPWAVAVLRGGCRQQRRWFGGGGGIGSDGSGRDDRAPTTIAGVRLQEDGLRRCGVGVGLRTKPRGRATS